MIKQPQPNQNISRVSHKVPGVNISSDQDKVILSQVGLTNQDSHLNKSESKVKIVDNNDTRNQSALDQEVNLLQQSSHLTSQQHKS